MTAFLQSLGGSRRINGRNPRRGSMPHHQTVDLNVHGDTVPIDRNIAPLVAALNKLLRGVHTLCIARRI